jgi:hypothetical protein
MKIHTFRRSSFGMQIESVPLHSYTLSQGKLCESFVVFSERAELRRCQVALQLKDDETRDPPIIEFLALLLEQFRRKDAIVLRSPLERGSIILKGFQHRNCFNRFSTLSNPVSYHFQSYW